MLSAPLMQMGILLLATIAVVAVIYALLEPLISGQRLIRKRIQSVVEPRSTRATRKAQADQITHRKKAVADTLKELEQREKRKAKVTLRMRLERAGLDISLRAFWIASLITGLICGCLTVALMPNMPPLVAAAAAFAGTLGLPRWVLTRMARRRQKKFLDEFANAIDVIVRGIKSGLPLSDCLGIVARESPEPVSSEFREIVEQQRAGVPLSESFERMMSRLPLPEVKFFAIVIAIQQQAGGNLSEALGNLSGVLRDRRRLQGKVQALSAEAKASAAVLGALPFTVMLLVYVTTPNYISMLWTTKMGQFLLVCSGIWMSMGIFVMKRMINFKY